MSHNPFSTIREFDAGSGRRGRFYSLPALEEAGLGGISRLPVSLRIILESVLRNVDGTKVTEDHVRQLAGWKPDEQRIHEIPFIVSRIILQDFTGVPLLCDLAAMRGAASRLGRDPAIIEPTVPVDLVIDHSVQIDHYGEPDALRKNMEVEFERNRERYQFLKWGMNAFKTFRVIPPGVGIVHQINLEHLARGVHHKGDIFYPDTLVGTDSHTTMINGIGVVGWGVGGIEAEAGMLGLPIYFLTPDVIGVHLRGALREGVTATDLVLTVTDVLRKEKVVGTFVEFYGEALSALSLPDRATVANMAPEYGATMGFFPVDDITLDYLRETGRREEEVTAVRAYLTAQRLYGVPKHGEIEYSRVVEIDISSIYPSIAGPRRPQERIELNELRTSVTDLLTKPLQEGGFAKKTEELSRRYPVSDNIDVGSGDVIIAAITSCTNTSNPGVLLAAGILAKKAVERGLETKNRVKTSLAPGSRVVTAYLKNAGLLPYLEQLGFYVSAYGCTTCIGNAGPLDEAIENAIVKNDLICAAAISGNRNFEARIHPNLRANFLMSPPLVVAFAIAGTVLYDPERDPLGVGKDGEDIFLRDIWPSRDEVTAMMKFAADPQIFRELYGDLTGGNELWNSVATVSGDVYSWPASTYIAEPPFFSRFNMEPKKMEDILSARALGIFGDSVTTDHISPAGSIKEASPAGKYLAEQGVPRSGFQSYGTRRGNHEVMIRGTFANVRIRNLMLPQGDDCSVTEGGYTLFQPSGEQLSMYDAAMKYRELLVPTVIFAGEEYGTGSSRDWAAKGTRLLGVRAVIAKSFERIHRSNLVGMGILPLQFMGSDSVQALGIRGDEEFDVLVPEQMKPRQEIRMIIRRRDGSSTGVMLRSRIDTPIETEYYSHAGILPYVLRSLLGRKDI